MTTQSSVIRRFDLDWLRVFGILTVFFFHSLRAFNPDPWSIKNAVTYLWVGSISHFLDVWMMPLIFVISGASIFYGLRGTSLKDAGKFLKDKVLRLLVPLVVGIFTYTTFEVYLDRLTNGFFSGSFLDFLPHYFDGIYIDSTTDGNFAFHGLHLWYLEVLFLFCVIALPAFLFLKSRFGSRLLGWITRISARFGLFYLIIPLPLVLAMNFVPEDSFLMMRLVAWGFLPFLLFLFGGYVIFSSEKLQDSIMRLRWVSLAVAIAFTYIYMSFDNSRDAMAWGWILTFLGFGRKYLQASTPFLQYANEAVLPFYIAHQTVLIIFGFWVVTWPVPDLLKWAILLAGSFGIIMVFYEFLVRRNNVLRVLSGMKPLKKAPRPAELTEKPLAAAN